eukprot:TRINITY_DN18530_c0_g1_i1.p1 TRINITY_DN18530_c0_g1~~TRINITY_DN18530_c0_g1_i1.p1  ORF type:complete len:481 (+),score=113.97 TRINITY_DN18530_c0_g1_i1:74-1516(+)
MSPATTLSRALPPLLLLLAALVSAEATAHSCVGRAEDCLAAWEDRSSASHAVDDGEEESDTVTLLTLPSKVSAKRVAPHRSGLAAASAMAPHKGEVPSFFQEDAIVEKPSPSSSQENIVVEAPEEWGQANKAAPAKLPSGALPQVVVDKALPGEPAGVPQSPAKELASSTWLLLLLTTLMLFLVVLAAWMLMARKKAAGRSSAQADLHQMVRSMHFTTEEELLAMLASQRGTDEPLNAGVLMKIEGRIVAKPGQAMSTPFSDRACVMYSASASRPRQDGVHQPPLAYHAAGSDFVLQLDALDESGKPLQVSVQSQDVCLFEMCAGRFAKEAAFADVAEAWKGFALSHLIHGSSTETASCNTMSSIIAKGDLEFCECSLLDGAWVTCVGEVVRERNGELSLCPWRPAIAGVEKLPQRDNGRVASLKRAVLGRLSMPSWEEQVASGAMPSPLAGQVFISDGSELRDMSREIWRQVQRGLGGV